jgi:hypothetical protein
LPDESRSKPAELHPAEAFQAAVSDAVASSVRIANILKRLSVEKELGKLEDQL